MEPVFLTISPDRLTEILDATAKLAAHEALRAAGLPVRDLVSASAMESIYGNHNFRRHKKKLTQHKVDGGKTILYSRAEFLKKCII